MGHISYIQILFLTILISNITYSQKQVSVSIIENSITVDFELLNRFEILSEAPYDSPFRVSYDNTKYLGFIEFKFDSLLSNGDTTVIIKPQKTPYKIECHYSEKKPINTWSVYDEKGRLKSKTLFSCGATREIEFFDSIGKLICLIEYPDDVEKRSEKWFYNGQTIKSVFRSCDGITMVYLYNEKGTLSWSFRYNDKELLNGIAYDGNGLQKYKVDMRWKGR